jgi:large-conductance mechanosensitive channel
MFYNKNLMTPKGSNVYRKIMFNHLFDTRGAVQRVCIFVILFLITNFYTQGQNVDDLFAPKSKSTGKEITLDVDTNLSKGKTAEQIEEERQDSIRQVGEKWKAFLTEMNAAVQELLSSVQESNPNTITKKEIKEYRAILNDLKEKFDLKLGKGNLWEDNESLDEMQMQFLSTHRKISEELDELLEGSGGSGSSINWMYIMVAILAVSMIGIPIFTQIKSGIMVRKAKKEQQQQAKKQQEEMEKQMLLSREDLVL